MINIRPAGQDDLAMLTALITASYAKLDPSDYQPGQLQAALPMMSKANPKLLASGTFYVAEIDGEAAGCGGWTFEAPGSGVLADGVAHIRHFATHPAHLRKGVARLLLDHCCAQAARRRAQLIKSQSTPAAEAFYASAGFRSLGRIDVVLAPGVILPAINMERSLR